MVLADQFLSPIHFAPSSRHVPAMVISTSKVWEFDRTPRECFHCGSVCTTYTPIQPNLLATMMVISTMKRTVQLFYWISGDPPSDSYKLTTYVEDGEPLLTASTLQKTLAATNERLAGMYLRMWRVNSNLYRPDISPFSNLLDVFRRSLSQLGTSTNFSSTQWTCLAQFCLQSVWVCTSRILQFLDI